MAATIQPANGDITTASDLPADIIIDIFIRLPFKFIVLCAARVCRTWRTVIRQPSFRLSFSPPTLSVVVLDYDTVKVVELNLDSFCIKVSHEASMPIPCLPFVGSCNGLVCFSSYYSNEVEICNPTIQRRVFLRVPRESRNQGQTLGIGFGYVPSTHKYKVVRICRVQKLGTLAYVSTIKAKNNAARILHVGKGNPISFVSALQERSVYHDGAIIWLGDSGKDLFYFDTEREKFGYLDFGADIFESRNIEIGVLCDSKGTSHLYFIPTHRFDIFKIWVMKDYNCIESLHLKWSIPLSDFPRCPERPLKVLEDGKLLISLVGGRSVGCYDPKTKVIKENGKIIIRLWGEMHVDAPNVLGCLL